MDALDNFRYDLVDQVVIIAKRLNLDAEYIENMPRRDRMRALKIVNQIVEAEKEVEKQMKK